MKILRFLFIAVFVFSTAITTVGAAPQQTVGFISLLNSYNPDIPVQVQTRDALHRIMPQVLAAKKSGQIKYFEPSMSTGVLKVVFKGNTPMAEFAGRPVYSRMEDIAVIVPASHPVRANATSAYFYVEVFDNCFDGYSLGAGTRVVGELFSGAQLMAVSDEYADGTGYLFDCFSWNGFYADVLPGYKVAFKLYDGTTNALLGSYTATASNIKFTAINKTQAIVSGTGPAKKPFDVYWYHQNLDAGDTYINPTLGGTISGAGTWSVDFATPPTIRGHDYLAVYVYPNSRFTFYRSMNAPAIYCQLGNNYCEISGFASTPATFKIMRGVTPYNFSGKFNQWGYFWIEWKNASGAPIFTKAGDKVSGTSVSSYTLPSLTASVNFSTDVVTGKAPAKKYFEVWALTHNPYTWYGVYSHTNSTGNYAANFASQVNLDPTRAVTVEVWYKDKTTGNIVDYYKPFGP